VSLEALICSLPKKVAGSGKESTRRFWLLSSVPLHAGGEFRCDIGSLGLIFLVVALVAGLLGFWGIAGLAAAIARVLFFVFLVIFLVSLIMGLMARSRP